MDWLATLRRSGGLHALARKLDASPADVMTAAGGLLPRLVASMREFVDQHGGEEVGIKALVDLVARMGDGDLAAQVMGPEPLRSDLGEQFLDHLMPGGRTATAPAGDPLQNQLFPGLAMLVAGYIGARAGGSGADGGNGVEDVAAMLELDWPRRRGGSARWNRGG